MSYCPCLLFSTVLLTLGYQASSSGRAFVPVQACSASVAAPGQWLGLRRGQSLTGVRTQTTLPKICCPPLWTHALRYLSHAAGEVDDTLQRQYGVELTADQWQPWDFDPLNLSPQHLAVGFDPDELACIEQVCCRCWVEAAQHSRPADLQTVSTPDCALEWAHNS